MKKLLVWLSSFSLILQPLTLIVACDPIESFPSVSSKISIEELNKKLFIHNNIQQVYFENLEYVGNYFEHLNFEAGLLNIKATEPIITIDSENLSEQELTFYNDLAQIFKPVSLGENKYDYTGLTFFIENIFIDDFTFSINNNKLESHVETTMAVSVLKGWKMMGKMLLTVTEENNSTGIIPYLFINTWLKSIYNNFMPILENDVFILNDEFDVDLHTFKQTFLDHQTALKGLNLNNEDIIIFEDMSGFSIMNQNYIFKTEEI